MLPAHFMSDLVALASRRYGAVLGGNYVLGDVLGVGGMGVVYAAVQRSLDRAVAVKMPRPDALASRDVERHFRTEAFVASKLWHANIVAVIDFGYTAEVPFLVMERVRGGVLGATIRDGGALAPALAVDLATQILDALSTAHAAGIVHADVKADNILLERRPDGRVLARLFDFGLARALELRGDREPGFVYGTPDYMAPELICGCPASETSDLYALGALLYEMLTGETPFAGASSEEVFAHQIDELPVPPSQRAELGVLAASLDTVVMRALEKRPGDRFRDARAFAAALREIVPVTELAALAPAAPPVRLPIREDASTLRDPASEAYGYSEEVQARRRAVACAILSGSGDEIVAEYLALARALVDEHDPAAAIAELEEAAELLRISDHGASSTWCVYVTLGALHAHLGDHARARQAAVDALELSTRSGSQLGQERAKALATRLERLASSSA